MSLDKIVQSSKEEGFEEISYSDAPEEFRNAVTSIIEKLQAAGHKPEFTVLRKTGNSSAIASNPVPETKLGVALLRAIGERTLEYLDSHKENGKFVHHEGCANWAILDIIDLLAGKEPDPDNEETARRAFPKDN